MKLDKNTQILIIGLGVIGGGYARALTRQGYRVAAITKEQRDVDYAREHGILQNATTVTDPALIQSADLLIFALYPHTFIDWIRTYGHLIRPGALVTDVTGVKSIVVGTVQDLLPPGVEFIAAHPMAGRERSGIEYSDDGVFRGANYIVTPTEKNTREAIETCRELGRILGFSRISELSPHEHDRMIAFLSQLTHIIAVALMDARDMTGLERYTGDSFRDLTRIAKINDAMWAELFYANREALLAEVDAFGQELSRFRELLAAGDMEGMRAKMRLSTARRALFDRPAPTAGPTAKSPAEPPTAPTAKPAAKSPAEPPATPETK